MMSSWTLNAATQTHITGVAQGQRAWLITTRTYDRNVSPVFLHFVSFTEAAGAQSSTHPLDEGFGELRSLMSSWTLNAATQTHFTGMAQRLARGAHNSEVTRSKRVAGIYHTSHRCIKALEQQHNTTHITGVAQGQRAVSLCRLITTRTYDRNVSPVFLHFASFAEAGRQQLSDVKTQRYNAGVAQWKSA
jgi:hypothetical protein